jgi:SAM-dependent methyltransferase
VQKITSDTVRADFNDPVAVVYYARAAHFLGLWKSERILIERFFPDTEVKLLEGGCGAGRVTIGLWDMGFQNISAFDFAEELLDQARNLAKERGARIQFFHADATRLSQAKQGKQSSVAPQSFDGVLFMFNGLMQIPGRENRRAALIELHRAAKPGAFFLFTTHDRNSSPRERASWKEEAERWKNGTQDPKLVEFGDRYFEDYAGRTFMHLPDRNEILEDLAQTGWSHVFDALRREITIESPAVREFSDECRFWAARKC